MNRDGRADFLIGNVMTGHQFEGLASIHSGADGSVLRVYEGTTPHAAFGASASSAGDVDRDGIEDVIIGAPGTRVNDVGVGSAHVFSGWDGAKIHEFFGRVKDKSFGWIVAGCGDVNGDSHPDLLVGENASTHAAGLLPHAEPDPGTAIQRFRPNRCGFVDA